MYKGTRNGGDKPKGAHCFHHNKQFFAIELTCKKKQLLRKKRLLILKESYGTAVYS